MQSQFNDDFPFEAIRANPALEHPAVQALSNFIGRYPHKCSATKAAFGKFRRLLDEVEAPWKDEMVAFTDAMLEGKYKREFRQLYNRRAGGQCASGEVSQTSSMMSQFTQALHYDLGD